VALLERGLGIAFGGPRARVEARDAPVAFDGRLDCGALDLDLECQGARLA
jgi:hypothetical protein